MSTTSPCPSGSVAYTVQSGDTLYLIARRIGSTVQAITALNPGINPDALAVGQRICVPGSAPSACAGTFYTIQPGDTFYAIAARYGTTVQALQAANPGVDPARLVIGQNICVPTVPAVVSTPCCALLPAVSAALPPGAEIPLGAVTVQQLAMSTRAYTVVARGLPAPSTLGNYDSYICLLTLFEADTGQRRAVIVRLVSSNIGTQNTTWAGSLAAAQPPVVGDIAEVRPFNSAAGAQTPQGTALLRGDLSNCRA